MSDCEALVWKFKETSGLLTIIAIFGFIQTPRIRIFRDRSIVQYRRPHNEENLKVYRTIIVTLLCTLRLQLLINFNQHALVLD